MKETLDNKLIWSEASRAGLYFGALSIACLTLKELAGMSGSAFLMGLASVVLWAVEFFGCILLMKNLMIRLRDKYYAVQMQQAYSFGKRAALLSGLLLSAASALFIMQTSPESLEAIVEQASAQAGITAAEKENIMSMIGNLPIFTFFFQWGYCYLYGVILSAIMSRYIFIRKLFDGPSPEDDPSTPDEQ